MFHLQDGHWQKQNYILPTVNLNAVGVLLLHSILLGYYWFMLTFTRGHLNLNNSQTKHDMNMKLALLDFSRQVAEGCRSSSSWLYTLGNQLINHSPYIKYTNRRYYLCNLISLLHVNSDVFQRTM